MGAPIARRETEARRRPRVIDERGAEGARTGSISLIKAGAKSLGRFLVSAIAETSPPLLVAFSTGADLARRLPRDAVFRDGAAGLGAAGLGDGLGDGRGGARGAARVAAAVSRPRRRPRVRPARGDDGGGLPPPRRGPRRGRGRPRPRVVLGPRGRVERVGGRVRVQVRPRRARGVAAASASAEAPSRSSSRRSSSATRPSSRRRSSPPPRGRLRAATDPCTRRSTASTRSCAGPGPATSPPSAEDGGTIPDAAAGVGPTPTRSSPTRAKLFAPLARDAAARASSAGEEEESDGRRDAVGSRRVRPIPDDDDTGGGGFFPPGTYPPRGSPRAPGPRGVFFPGPAPPRGARFDPYGPPDIPEFAPGRFDGGTLPGFGFPENPDAAFGGVPDGFGGGGAFGGGESFGRKAPRRRGRDPDSPRG